VLAEARDLGFFGPGPLGPQLEHARAFLPLLGTPGSVVDLGTGGGLPGLVLLRALPDTTFVLVESQQRRAAFLREALARLGAEDRATVLEDRAEVVGRAPDHRERHDAVVARSFAAPAVTAECAAPLLRVGGVLVVSDPPAGGEARWPADPLRELGLAVATRTTTPSLTSLEKVMGTSERFPRPVGRPAKRPLWTV
jgi:16S rRNA (guanine527-N7)-methyltransferase